METRPTGRPEAAPQPMTAEEYDKRLSDLDKEHDRRAALLDATDYDALDRLECWHAKMSDMIDNQYCNPPGTGDADLMGDAIAATEFSGSNDEVGEVLTALGRIPDA